MMDIDLKKQYNKQLQRHFKAKEYFNNPNINLDAKEKRIPEYQIILSKLNESLIEMDSLGIKYTQNEGLNGFEIPT